MTVQGLIEHLKTFDGNLSVIAVNDTTEEDFIVSDVIWEMDGYCKIIILED